MNKGFILSAFTILLHILIFSAEAKVETIIGKPVDSNDNLAFGLPSTDNPEIVLSRDQYILSYNKLRRIPNYVAWKLETSQIGTAGRSNNFALDEELENYLAQTSNLKAVDPTDYKGSCFDRGHQIPSADRTDTRENNEATFLMSNMIPQTAYLNRVIWEHLEQYSRDLVQKQKKKLYIIAGPIFDKPMGAIGPNKDIQIPSKNFKLIYVLNSNQNANDIDIRKPTIAVIMPNMLQNGSTDLSDRAELCKPIITNGTDSRDWEKYKATLSEVEKLSNLSFANAVDH